MHARQPDRRSAGFTLIEALVTVAILAVLLTLGMPALDRFVHRGQLEGAARQTAALMQVARFDAIKHGVPARFVFDFDADQVWAYTDLDQNEAFDAAVDRELGRVTLPAGVTFRAAGGNPEDDEAIVGWDPCADADPGGCGQFESNGAVNVTNVEGVDAAVRFGDERGNYLQVRLMIPATGRLEIGKARNPLIADYYANGENGEYWSWN